MTDHKILKDVFGPDACTVCGLMGDELAQPCSGPPGGTGCDDDRLPGSADQWRAFLDGLVCTCGVDEDDPACPRCTAKREWEP